MESEEPTDADRAAGGAAVRARRRRRDRCSRWTVGRGRRPVSTACISVPDRLSAWCETSTYERAFHVYGASFTDRTRVFNLQFTNPPRRRRPSP